MISLLILIAVIGLFTWAIVTFIPMPAPFPKIIIAIAVIFCILIALKAFGVLPIGDVAVPQVR
jgi:hypothetical protein